MCANGWYDVKTGDIYIDINAGLRGDGVMLFTLSHELVHDIAVHAPAKFKILADFLMEQYGKKGVPVDELVQAQIDKAKRNGRDIDYDTAYEEVIADSCESLLSDGEVIQKLAELRARDEGLFEKIKSFITKLVARIKRAYAGMKPDSYEGRIVSEMVDEAERLKELFADALLDASEAKNVIDSQSVLIDENPNDGIRYSFRNTKSGMANDALLPYNAELRSIIESRGDYIIDDYNKLVAFVDRAFDNKQEKATAYFGNIDSSKLIQIKNNVANLPTELNGELFKAGKDYSIIATMDSVRHMVDEKNLTREDVISYLDKFADTIVNFDSVNFNYYIKGKNRVSGLIFKKTFSDGTLISFNLISHKKRGIELQSLSLDSVSYQKKKSANTLLMQNAHSKTPVAQVGQTSVSIVSQKNADVNDQIKENSENVSENEYSDRDPIDIEQYKKVNRQLEKETAKLKEDVNDLKELVKLQRKVTHGQVLKPSSLDAVTRKIMRESNAKGDTKEFSRLLSDVYQYIIKGQDVTWDGIKEKAQPAVQWLMNHEGSVAHRTEFANEVLSFFKGYSFSLSEGQKSEIANQYGSFNNFRKQAFGSLSINKDATSLDSLWGEICEAFPSLFDPETSDKDQPLVLMSVIDSMKNSYQMEFEFDGDMRAQELLAKIYDGYWAVSTLHTVADSKQVQINRLKYKHSEQMSQIRASHENSVTELKKDFQKRLDSLKRSKEERYNKTVDHFRESRKKAVEGREKTAMRHKIRNVVNDLKTQIKKHLRTAIGKQVFLCIVCCLRGDCIQI